MSLFFGSWYMGQFSHDLWIYNKSYDQLINKINYYIN